MWNPEKNTRQPIILSTWKPITRVLQDLDKDQSHYLTASKTFANQIWLVSACIKLIMGLWFHFISARNYESFFYYPELVAIRNNRLLPANLPDNWHWPSVKRLSFSMKIFVGSAERKRAAVKLLGLDQTQKLTGPWNLGLVHHTSKWDLHHVTQHSKSIAHYTIMSFPFSGSKYWFWSKKKYILEKWLLSPIFSNYIKRWS